MEVPKADRWTAAGLLEAQKTFRRLKAYRQLPILRNALQEHLRKAQADSAIETIMKAAQHHQPATPAPRISTEIGTSPAYHQDGRTLRSKHPWFDCLKSHLADAGHT